MSREKTIHDLKLHEKMVDDYFKIQRVPGGWLYFNAGCGMSCFVPYSDEFNSPNN